MYNNIILNTTLNLLFECNYSYSKLLNQHNNNDIISELIIKLRNYLYSLHSVNNLSFTKINVLYIKKNHKLSLNLNKYHSRLINSSFNSYMNKYYYASFVSIPFFDSILFDVLQFNKQPASKFKKDPINGINEERIATPNLIKKINTYCDIDPLFNFIFSEKTMDLRTKFSHAFFISSKEIELCSFFYILLCTNVFIKKRNFLYGR